MALDSVLAHHTPKLKARVLNWNEVKSFDPAFRTEKLSSVPAPQSLLLFREKQRGLLKAVINSGRYTQIIYREEKIDNMVGLGGGVGMNVSFGMG